MATWIALSRSQHARHAYLPRHGYTFAATQSLVPVMLVELARLLPHFALGFIEREQRYLPVALLGLDGQHNLYVNHDGRWLGNYVPADLRGYPFTLANTEQGQQALCIAGDHLLETEGDAGESIFNGEDGLSDSVAEVLNFLQQREKSRAQTLAASALLAEHQLLEPWPLEIDRGEEQSPLRIEGLYRIDEKALQQVSSDVLTELRDKGGLALAYGQLFSMLQLDQLKQRAVYHQQRQAGQEETLPDFFGEGDDELTFDFDN